MVEQAVDVMMTSEVGDDRAGRRHEQHHSGTVARDHAAHMTGTTIRTSGRKFVKNLKYTNTGLAVDILDQFVMKYLGPSILGTDEDIRSNKVCRFLTQC